MKKWTLVILLSSLLGACKKEQGETQLGIDVQSFFQGDSLTVWLDNRQIFSRKVTTNAALGAALKDDGSISTLLDTKKGAHTISVQFKNNTKLTEAFKLNNALYIGVNYNREVDKLQLVYSNERFTYD